MCYNFNADEIFEIAEQIERKGANFYRTAEENITDEDKKKLLIHLAEMEDDHEKTFKTLRDELSENEKTMTTFDPEDETADYLRLLADTRVFYEKEVDATSLNEVFKTAITAEKDSIVFYLGMKNVVPSHQGKNWLDRIIKEEMDHIRLLSKELLELMK